MLLYKFHLQFTLHLQLHCYNNNELYDVCFDSVVYMQHELTSS